MELKRNNEYAKYEDGCTYAKNFVKQPYGEVYTVRVVEGAVQTTAQSGQMPSFCNFSLKLSSSRKLWHPHRW